MMDQRFNDVLDKMDNLFEENKQIQSKINTLFQDVKDSQEEIKNKVNDVDNEVKDVLGNFKKKYEKLVDNINAEIEGQKSQYDKEIEQKLHALESVHNDYSSKVDKLLEKIDKRSDKILAIYDELEEIKKVRQDINEDLSSLINKQNEAIQEFKERGNNIIKNSKVGNIERKMKSISKRIDKIEKHAHKHIIGGLEL